MMQTTAVPTNDHLGEAGKLKYDAPHLNILGPNPPPFRQRPERNVLNNCEEQQKFPIFLSRENAFVRTSDCGMQCGESDRYNTSVSGIGRSRSVSDTHATLSIHALDSWS